jgi:hypothetical protein
MEDVRLKVLKINAVYLEEAIVAKVVFGTGTDDDPVRIGYFYFTKDGRLIGQVES